jgi:hypothetical protein
MTTSPKRQIRCAHITPVTPHTTTSNPQPHPQTIGGPMSDSLKYRIANAILLVLTAVLAAGCWEC